MMLPQQLRLQLVVRLRAELRLPPMQGNLTPGQRNRMPVLRNRTRAEPHRIKAPQANWSGVDEDSVHFGDGIPETSAAATTRMTTTAIPDLAVDEDSAGMASVGAGRSVN